MQYKPHRLEVEILEGFDNARDAFMANEEQLKRTSKNMELYRERDKQLENAFNQVHAFELLQEPNETNTVDEEELPEERMGDEQYQKARHAMNGDQRQLVNRITESIYRQINGERNKEMIFVTGGAGTGKTFLFNFLKEHINRCYGKQVVKVGALTGVAARLIGGTTLHRLLRLPVQKDGVIVNMPLLRGPYLTTMRLQWQDIKFVFIDEISMVPYQMLCMIDSRLRQLSNKDDVFGGLNVLLFGDLMQLPPVRGDQVFNQPVYMRPARHLWKCFDLFELRQNMRQKGDTTFTDILNALRVGELSSAHLEVLLQKVKTDSDDDDNRFSIENALRIYPTNEQVEKHNKAVLDHFRRKGVQIHEIKAHDKFVDNHRSMANKSVDSVISEDTNKTGGLPKVLHIFKGAKIMLRSNINITKGLVNGNIGIIKDIIWYGFRRDQVYDKDIPKLLIDFGKDGEHIIEPISVQFPAKYSHGTAERRMLPVILSWASTVHKMQGCTMDSEVIYLEPKLFAAGQAYVALSRVKTLDGLRIEELECSKLTGKTPCNLEALNEMNTLRNLNK